MHLVDCLDLGATLSPTAPCLMADDAVLSYAEVQGLSRSVAASLAAYGVGPGHTVGLLSPLDPLVASCLLGVDRAGAAWAVVDPAGPPDGVDADLVRSLAGCSVLLTRTEHARLVGVLRPFLPRLRQVVLLDRPAASPDEAAGTAGPAHGWGEFLVAGLGHDALHVVRPAAVPAPDATEHPPAYLTPLDAAARSVRRWGPVLARGGQVVIRTAAGSAGSELPDAERRRLEA